MIFSIDIQVQVIDQPKAQEPKRQPTQQDIDNKIVGTVHELSTQQKYECLMLLIV